ncbi:MAG: tetratricopeptide repeat protein [Gallionella sp.]|nr:tetratricopeptide repeat protein [Gallionella sp.]
MSLLLDARKKSQDDQGSDSSRSGLAQGIEADPHNISSPYNTSPPSGDSARLVGQNLFGAKSSSAHEAFAGINRNLLYALGGTVLLLTAGGGYVWYVTSEGNHQPLRPAARAPVAPPVAQQPPAIAEAPPKIALLSKEAPPKPARPKPPKRTPQAAEQQTSGKPPLLIEQHQAESIDPLLNSAYLAYREGKFDRAQQLYREALKLDGRNTDALLGLAAIAQRRGADGVAAHYYAKVLELNPRDAVANAGMSALTSNDNVESRLKILLNEQQDSAALHFALGNFFASQERWGEAQQAYFNAHKLDPNNAGLAFHLAISLDRAGKKKLAAQYYQSALQLDPTHSEGFDHAKILQRIEELNR